MKTITYAGIFMLSTMFASAAFAGCGKPSRFNFPAMSLKEKAPMARKLAETPASAADPSRGNVVGLWLSTVSAGGQTAFQSFEAFTQDGLEFLNDNGSPIEGNVCFGVWSSDGRNVAVSHPAWNYDSGGNLTGSVVIREQITLSANGSAFNGTVSVEAFDVNGNSFGIVFEGTVTGKRITG